MTQIPESLTEMLGPDPTGPFASANRQRALCDLVRHGVHRIVKTLSGPNQCALSAIGRCEDGVEKLLIDLPIAVQNWQRWFDEEDWTNDELEALRHAVTRKIVPPPHNIIVDLDGGLVQDVHALPPGVRVVVRDYDIEGADDDELHTDDSGAKYYQSVYARTCPVCNGEHPPCTMCGGVTRCDPEEPGEAFTLCDSCEAEMKGGA